MGGRQRDLQEPDVHHHWGRPPHLGLHGLWRFVYRVIVARLPSVEGAGPEAAEGKSASQGPGESFEGRFSSVFLSNETGYRFNIIMLASISDVAFWICLGDEVNGGISGFVCACTCGNLSPVSGHYDQQFNVCVLSLALAASHHPLPGRPGQVEVRELSQIVKQVESRY